MPQCLVKTCGNYYGKTRSGNKVIYHMLPSNPQLQSKWVELCTNKKNVKVNGYARVCSEHFSENSYQRDLQHELLGLPLRRKLKPDALPERNLPPKVLANLNQDERNFKIPMRSSIRIAKKKSLEFANSEKLKFMSKLSLRNVTLPTYNFALSLDKIQELQTDNSSPR